MQTSHTGQNHLLIHHLPYTGLNPFTGSFVENTQTLTHTHNTHRQRHTHTETQTETETETETDRDRDTTHTDHTHGHTHTDTHTHHTTHTHTHPQHTHTTTHRQTHTTDTDTHKVCVFSGSINIQVKRHKNSKKPHLWNVMKVTYFIYTLKALCSISRSDKKRWTV